MKTKTCSVTIDNLTGYVYPSFNTYHSVQFTVLGRKPYDYVESAYLYLLVRVANPNQGSFDTEIHMPTPVPAAA